MAADKELKVRFTGDRTALGAASKQAVQDLEEVGRAAEKIGRDLGREIGRGFKGLGALIGNEIRRGIEEGSKINTQASLAGVSSNFVRGGKAAFGRLGVEDAFDPSLAAVGQARAEALAGNADIAAAFRKYGVDFTKPLEDVFRDLLLNLRNARIGIGDAIPLQTLLGSSAQPALFAAQNRAGFNLGNEASAASFFGYRFFEMADKGKEFLFGRSFKGPEGTTLPTKTAEQNVADSLKQEDRDAKTLKSRRELMTLEKAILDVKKEQAMVAYRLAGETDPKKRQQLADDLAQMESEQRDLEKRQRKPARRDDGFKMETDEFAQRGIDIGGQRRVPNILEKNLVELQALVREVRETRRENKDLWQ